jgi:hypothetical protein
VEATHKVNWKRVDSWACGICVAAVFGACAYWLLYAAYWSVVVFVEWMNKP